MRHAIAAAVIAASLLAGSITPSLARPSCATAERTIDEAGALRRQARAEARLGDHGRLCDTLDEVGDRYTDARDALEDCGAGAAAIDLRSESRALRVAKSINRCD